MQMVEFLEPLEKDINATLWVAICHGQNEEPAPFKNEVEFLLHKYRDSFGRDQLG